MGVAIVWEGYGRRKIRRYKTPTRVLFNTTADFTSHGMLGFGGPPNEVCAPFSSEFMVFYVSSCQEGQLGHC